MAAWYWAVRGQDVLDGRRAQESRLARMNNSQGRHLVTFLFSEVGALLLSLSAMQLFYLTQRNYDEFNLCFKVELLILFLDYPLIIAYIMIIRRVRCHLNIKVLSFFLCLQFALYLTTRVFVLAIQSQVLINHEEQVAPTYLVAGCSFFQGYYFLLILTSIFWLSLERLLARYYIEDYEASTRLWIPATIIVSAILICGAGSAVYIFELVPWYVLISIGLLLMFSGVVIICRCYRTTVAFHEEMKKLTDFNAQKIKYQAEKGVFSTNLVRSSCVITANLNVATVMALLAVHLSPYGEETRQLMYCLLTIFIALNSPLMAVSGLCFNPYLRKVTKSMLCPTQWKYKQQVPRGRIFARQQPHEEPPTETTTAERSEIQMRDFVARAEDEDTQ